MLHRDIPTDIEAAPLGTVRTALEDSGSFPHRSAGMLPDLPAGIAAARTWRCRAGGRRLLGASQTSPAKRWHPRGVISKVQPVF